MYEFNTFKNANCSSFRRMESSGWYFILNLCLRKWKWKRIRISSMITFYFIFEGSSKICLYHINGDMSLHFEKSNQANWKKKTEYKSNSEFNCQTYRFNQTDLLEPNHSISLIFNNTNYTISYCNLKTILSRHSQNIQRNFLLYFFLSVCRHFPMALFFLTFPLFRKMLYGYFLNFIIYNLLLSSIKEMFYGFLPLLLKHFFTEVFIFFLCSIV